MRNKLAQKLIIIIMADLIIIIIGITDTDGGEVGIIDLKQPLKKNKLKCQIKKMKEKEVIKSKQLCNKTLKKI